MYGSNDVVKMGDDDEEDADDDGNDDDDDDDDGDDTILLSLLLLLLLLLMPFSSIFDSPFSFSITIIGFDDVSGDRPGMLEI